MNIPNPDVALFNIIAVLINMVLFTLVAHRKGRRWLPWFLYGLFAGSICFYWAASGAYLIAVWLLVIFGWGYLFLVKSHKQCPDCMARADTRARVCQVCRHRWVAIGVEES